MTPGPNSTPAEWDRWVALAPSFADAQDRLELAVAAGVDIAAMLKAQAER